MHSSLIVLIVILLNIQSLVQTSQQFVFHCNPNPCLNGGECIVHHNNTSNSNRNTHRLTTHHCRCPHSHVGSRCQFVSPCFQQNRCLNGGTCHTIPGARDTALETQPGFRCACALGFSASLCEIAIPSACDSSPCAHNGRCVLTADLDHYRCDCALGWRGHTCEQRDNCVSSPCKNAATCVSRDHGFECVCASGFTGHTCTADVDECHEVWTSSGGDACSANGVCINTMGSFRCVCERGFTGARCDTRYVPCSANPCLNAGSCVPHFASLSYSCVCRVGFTGRDCDTNVDDCGGNLCQNGATCVDGLNTYTCSCPESHATGLAQWSGPYCSRDVDECSLRPHVCSNGATCVNTLGSFQCICVNGWTGVTCDTNIDDCAAAACFNGATCHDRIASFYCECPPGKTGLLCHLDDACASNPCHAGAICDTSPVDGTYVCSCRPGFKGVDCTQDIDECRESGSPCEHGGTCVNTPGSFRCDCSNGFAGPRCEVNINECDSSPCLNDGTCLDERGQFKCVCMPGYSGLHCEHDIDECASNPCLNDAICTDLIAGFRCLCPPGFDGTRCERNLDDCSSQPCLNGGTCSDEVSTFSCTCALGFTGRTCESNIDDCESSPCHHGSCRDGHNSFTCQCAPGYTGLLCQSKINECLSSPCLNGGKCSDHDNGYTCQCVTGVTGANCEYNVNECWSNPCRNGGTCRDLIGQYQCDCVHGYSGVNCEHDIDECASSPCANGGTCSQSRSHPNGYRCMCPHGFYGTRCLASTDECASNPCLNGGTCDDDVNRFVCYCARGFTGSRCESEVNECTRVTDTCLNGGTCLDRRRGSYECLCVFGFTGNRCEANINDCHDNPCRNGGTCRDLIGQYRCECTRGYEGTNCEQEVDECASNPCANTGTCVQTHFGYRCLCAHGFYGTRCLSKVDECASNPCLNGGTCDDDINQFVCHCLRGFTGTRCETNVNECAHVTCMNGGTCLDGIDTYTCVCSRGFVGRHCETRDSTSSNADDPWNKCALAHHCRSRFGDLKCDEECNSRECLFDGTDCRPAARGAGEHACNELYDAYCARNFANGHCDFGCNNAECAWDGLDCEARNTGGSGRSDDPKQHNDFVLRDALIIVVDAPPSLLTAHTAEAKHALSSLLRDLSTFIGSVVTLREMRANGSHATQLVLVVDNRRCANNQCFDTTRDIAHFLSASQTRMTIAPGFRITSADAEDSSSLDTPTHTPPQPHGLTYVAVSVVVLLVGGALLGVLVTTSRKKVARGITWFPEGFFTNQMTRESSREAARNNASAHAANGEYGRTRRRNAMNMNGGARTGRPDGQEMRAFKSHDELVCDDKSACAIYEEPMECRAWSHAHYEAYGSDSMTPPLSTPSIDALGPNGMTPLMVASAFPHHAITIDNPDTCNDSNNAVHDLLMSGANVSLACERTHETSLHLAARYARADAAKRLLEGGADCNATDATGRTPLHTAIASDARGVFEILLRNRSTNLNARANDGTTPLILCARLANEGMLDQLVLSECDLNACDDCGKTALHWAASVNNCDAVRVLLQNGANRDAQNAREETPLFLAAREGAFQCAKLLLECHANRDITDHMDRLPRDVALERMHTDIVALLDEFVPPPPQTNQSNQNSNQNPISPQQQSQTRQSTASLQRRKANSRVNGSAVGGVNSNVPPIPPPRDTKPLTLTRDNTRVTFNEICSPPSRPPPAYEECVNKSLQSTRVTNNGMSSHVVVLPQWNHSQPRPPESYLTPSPDSPGTWSSPSTSSPASVVTAHDWLPVCSSGADNNSVTAQSQSNRYLNGMSLNGQTMTSPQQQQSQQHHSHISSTQTAVFI